MPRKTKPKTKRGDKRLDGAPRKRPVPGTFTAEKKTNFLKLYETGLTVAEAARKIGVTPTTIFNHARVDEDFGERYRHAMETNTDVLEDTLHTLARNGNVAALFGTLKARRPERWRDRVDVSNQDGSLLKPLAEAIKRANGIGRAEEPPAELPEARLQ